MVFLGVRRRDRFGDLVVLAVWVVGREVEEFFGFVLVIWD